MNTQFYDELKSIPNLAGVIELIDSIESIDDNSITEENFQAVQSAIMESMESLNYNDVINQMIDEYKSKHVAKDTVMADTKQSVDALKTIPNELAFTSEYKTKILSDIIGKICTVIEMGGNEYYEEDAKVYFQLCKPNAKIPTRATTGAAGYDVYAPEDITIPAHASGKIVGLGWKCALPSGWQFEMRPRSGMSVKTGIRISNAPGTIDSDYRDEVGAIIDNKSSKSIEFKTGDRIAQIVLMPVYTFLPEVIDDITKIEGNRGGGFGSTGV